MTTTTTIPDVIVVKAVAGWLGVDLAGANPVAVTFAVQQYEDRMRDALSAVWDDIEAAALNAAADAVPPSTMPLGGELAISESVRMRFQQWLRAQAGGVG